MEEQTIEKTCKLCGNLGMSDGADGFYYCTLCGSQDDDIHDTGVNDEDLYDDGGGALYQSNRCRTIRPSAASQASQCQRLSQLYWSQVTQEDAANLTQNSMSIKRERDEWDFDGIGPTGPEDFGSLGGQVELGYEDYYNEVRGRYVMGLQKMIQLQCEALVEKFNVTPLICGVSGTIWLRYVASTKVFDDEWADEVIQDSEFQESGEAKKPRTHREEPHNLYGQRAVTVWCRDLKKKMPLSCSLAVSFLACHVAREAILPTDLVKWSIQGKLPFFAAYIDIEKEFTQSSLACPISSSIMFRPSQSINAQKLESFAASIAQAIGLHLPSVNFHGIASRYIQQLSLSLEKILPHACRIYEWSKPPELWLSANELRLPSRVFVMSILIVAIRNLYNIHGFGAWERSLSGPRVGDNVQKVSVSSSNTKDGLCAKSVRNLSHAKNPVWDASELLSKLEASYNGNVEAYVFSKDLQVFLQFCGDTAFPGYNPSVDDHVEEKITKMFSEFYQNMKVPEPPGDLGQQHCSPSNMVDNCPQLSADVRHLPTVDDASSKTSQSNAIRKLKLDMEEHRFCYIPPRRNIKVLDYLHYVRKRDEGTLTYAAHADYYILLRACAQVAQVDIRIMHLGVLSFELRLAWLEKMTDHCLSGISCVSDESSDGQEKLIDSRTTQFLKGLPLLPCKQSQ